MTRKKNGKMNNDRKEGKYLYALKYWRLRFLSPVPIWTSG